MATWEEVWAGMTPEQQAAYTSGAAGAGAAAATQAAQTASANIPIADRIALYNASAATMEDILRASEASGGVSSTAGVRGANGQLMTNMGATTSAIQNADAPEWARGELNRELVDQLMTPSYQPSTKDATELFAPNYLSVSAENMQAVADEYKRAYGANWQERLAADYPDISKLHPGGTAPDLSMASPAGDYASLPEFTVIDAATGFSPIGPASRGDVEGAAENMFFATPGAEKVVKGVVGEGGLIGNPDSSKSGAIADVAVGGANRDANPLANLYGTPDYATVATSINATDPDVLNRSDFEVQGITDPWLLPGINETAGQLYQEGLDFAPREAPEIIGGTPEDIAAYERAIKTQRNLAGNVGANTNVQAQNLKDIMAGRGLYEAAARGEAPSAAEIQMQMGLTQAQKQALSMAATSRDPGGWYRAQRAMGNLQNSAITETAKLRAEEMAQARAALSQYYGTLGQAGYQVTAGAAAGAAAASDVTQQTLARLAQEQNISIEQARDILLSRQTDDTARTNIINSATNLINARTQALQGQSAENQAIAAGKQAYATAQSGQQVTMRGQDIGAQSAENVARIGTTSDENIEASRAKTARNAGYLGAGATVVAGGLTALGGSSGGQQPSTTAAPATPATTTQSPYPQSSLNTSEPYPTPTTLENELITRGQEIPDEEEA